MDKVIFSVKNYFYLKRASIRQLRQPRKDVAEAVASVFNSLVDQEIINPRKEETAFNLSEQRITPESVEAILNVYHLFFTQRLPYNELPKIVQKCFELNEEEAKIFQHAFWKEKRPLVRKTIGTKILELIKRKAWQEEQKNLENLLKLSDRAKKLPSFSPPDRIELAPQIVRIVVPAPNSCSAVGEIIEREIEIPEGREYLLTSERVSLSRSGPMGLYSDTEGNQIELGKILKIIEKEGIKLENFDPWAPFLLGCPIIQLRNRKGQIFIVAEQLYDLVLSLLERYPSETKVNINFKVRADCYELILSTYELKENYIPENIIGMKASVGFIKLNPSL